ncbi:MAG: NAD(P)-binding domain-containing protein [Pirellulaceae bacterium]
MTVKSIGFIGGGRATQILIGGWAKSEKLPCEIVVSDPDESVLARLKENHSEVQIVANGNERAVSQDIVFLAVHPPAIADAMANVKTGIKPDAVLVSLAPKLTISRLSEMLDGFGRIARMIPNAPSIVGAGFNPIAFGDQLPAWERDVLSELLSGLGECPVVAEDKLEAYAVITAMGPTHFWPQLYELESLAESFGLSPTEAREGIWQTVCGTLATMFNSGLDRSAVEDLIPVKPLAELEGPIREAYHTKLPAIMEKIRP